MTERIIHLFEGGRVHDLDLAAQQLDSLDARKAQAEAAAHAADLYVAAGHAVTHYARVAAQKRAEADRLEALAAALFAKVHPALVNGEPQQGIPDRCLGCERYLADGITFGRGQYCEPCFRIGIGVDERPKAPTAERDILDLIDRL